MTTANNGANAGIKTEDLPVFGNTRNDSKADQLPHRINAEHLPSAIQIHDKVISGGQPEGDAAFRELQDPGVKTVISVHGVTPDLELATKHGLKSVHLAITSVSCRKAATDSGRLDLSELRRRKICRRVCRINPIPGLVGVVMKRACIAINVNTP